MSTQTQEKRKRLAAEFLELLKVNAPTLYQDYIKNKNIPDDTQTTLDNIPTQQRIIRGTLF